MKQEERRTARLSVRVRPGALPMLRRMARMCKKSVAQYVRDALAEQACHDLELFALAKRHLAWQKKQRGK